LALVAVPACAAAPGPDDTNGSATSAATSPAEVAAACETRKLRFSADELIDVPSGAFVWGGNATEGKEHLDPPYAPAFLARVATARSKRVPVFAYLEGPCGNTDGADDGEISRCADIHRRYNEQFAPETPDTPEARWKPYTMKQLTTSKANGVDFCEIDNLDNQVTIPLVPLLKEIKSQFDEGTIHCRLVLKNVDAEAIAELRSRVARTPAEAAFIAPFAIYEARDTAEQAELTRAMIALKGPGAVTIMSADILPGKPPRPNGWATNHYGSSFTDDTFKVCP
jgi:hypothetical protein